MLQCATEYEIVNDQFTVFNPTEQQLKNSFKHFKIKEDHQPEEITSTDKECFLVMFQELTKLKSIWCTRYYLNWLSYVFLKLFNVFF